MSKKKQPSYTPNLFEPQLLPQAAEEQTKTEPSSPPAPPKIKDPCPHCGGRSAVSKRPWESGGTHYCLGGCLSEDRMDCFYFTPKKEEGAVPF